MPDTPALPSKVKLELVVHYLNLNQLSYDFAIETIFDLHKQNGLKLYFDNRLLATEASTFDRYSSHGVNFGETHIQESKEKPQKPIYEDIYGKKEILVPEKGGTDLNGDELIVYGFFKKGVEFYTHPEDAHGYYPMIHIDDIYCIREELENFLNNHSQDRSNSLSVKSNDDGGDSTELKNHISKTTNDTKALKKEPKKVKKQETAFMEWLIQESKLELSSDDDFYQRCYREIGRPTREEVWKALTVFAPDLFTEKLEASIKAQNFFNKSKGGQNIVSFEGNER